MERDSEDTQEPGRENAPVFLLQPLPKNLLLEKSPPVF